MSNKASRQRMLYLVTIVIGIGGAFAFVAFGLPQENGDVFNIPFPASITGTNENPDVECRYRTTLNIIDAGGNTARTTSTSSIFGHPTFSVVDVQSGKSTAGYVVEPMGGCNSLNLPITIDKSAMTAIFEAQAKDGTWKVIATKSFYTKPLSLPAKFGVGVKSLGYTSILSQAIEDALGSGFTSAVRVKVTGVLNIYYTDYQGARFYYQITAGKSTVDGGTIKLVSPTQVTDPNTKDVDADGILDIYDACDTQKEVFNGYKDGDGCPDTLPTTPPACSSTEELVNGVCKPKSTTTSGGCLAPKVVIDGVCSDAPPPETEGGITCQSTSTTQCPAPDNPVDTTAECQAKHGTATEKYEWDSVNSLCKPVVSGGTTGGTTPLGIVNTHILVSPKYRDGTLQGFTLPLEGQAPLTINFQPQELIGSFTGANAKGLVEIDFDLYVETSGGTSWKVKSHSVLLKPTIRVSGTDIPLKEELFVGYSTSNSKTFTLPKATSGSITFVGLTLGKADILSSDIELKIPKELVPNGQRRDVQLTALIAGTVTLESNSGTVVTGELKDGKIEWLLEIERKTADLVTKNLCEEGQYAVATTGDIKCVDFGEPAPEEGSGLCTVGQAGCQICTDDSSAGIGGFPCTQLYRDTYCAGKTQCTAPPPEDKEQIKEAPEGCDLTASCISTQVGGTKENPIPLNLNGGFPQVTDLNSLALILGIFAIIAGIGIAIYKKRG